MPSLMPERRSISLMGFAVLFVCSRIAATSRFLVRAGPLSISWGDGPDGRPGARPKMNWRVGLVYGDGAERTPSRGTFVRGTVGGRAPGGSRGSPLDR